MIIYDASYNEDIHFIKTSLKLISNRIAGLNPHQLEKPNPEQQQSGKPRAVEAHNEALEGL
jgi:hypothetical protein